MLQLANKLHGAREATRMYPKVFGLSR